MNTFIHSRSFLENHTRLQTKMGEVYTRFQAKTAQKPYPFGTAHTYMASIREYPRRGGGRTTKEQLPVCNLQCQKQTLLNQLYTVTPSKPYATANQM